MLCIAHDLIHNKGEFECITFMYLFVMFPDHPDDQQSGYRFKRGVF